MEKDLIIADIITYEMSLSPERVVIYGQNYEPPEDEEIYVVIKTMNGKPLGNTNKFNQDTGNEEKAVSSFNSFEIEITSKNRSAYERKEEILMALTSFYSEQQQELYEFRIFRTNQINDLTFIEGGSSLYRFSIPVRCTDIKKKVTQVEYFDKLRDVNSDIQRR